MLCVSSTLLPFSRRHATLPERRQRVISIKKCWYQSNAIPLTRYPLRQKRNRSAVVHVRHHWVLAEFVPCSSGLAFVVWDSARSSAVEHDLTKWASELGVLPPRFEVCPQQVRDSNECGLFAITFALLRARGLRPPANGAKVSLARLRDLFPDREAMLAEARKAFGMDEGVPSPGRSWSHKPYDSGSGASPSALDRARAVVQHVNSELRRVPAQRPVKVIWLRFPLSRRVFISHTRTIPSSARVTRPVSCPSTSDICASPRVCAPTQTACCSVSVSARKRLCPGKSCTASPDPYCTRV